MSHFTNIETHFQNLFYLEKALNKLDIAHTRQKKITNVHNSKSHDIDINLKISQQNGYDVEFCWNGQEYELVTDTSFWEQRDSITGFVNNIAKQYAGEVIIGESQKIGFQPIKYQQNEDGSNTVTLQRWNEKKETSL
uniref:Uncharacterized protein ycf35 n=1 Tax=Plagiogrammopsis vanheurckii TaxID=1234821 RepID=A0A2U9NNB8_9STRA|nr:hypothetical protein ycf35 [Plagiogrammopsis vanheurckii]AWT38604.1 hypothetical protein ycf35 [Plagiogrammopsis vanheurckii]